MAVTLFCGGLLLLAVPRRKIHSKGASGSVLHSIKGSIQAKTHSCHYFPNSTRSRHHLSQGQHDRQVGPKSRSKFCQQFELFQEFIASSMLCICIKRNLSLLTLHVSWLLVSSKN